MKRIISISIIVLCFALYFRCNVYKDNALAFNNSFENYMEFTAHRGNSSKAPENSISSIKKAIAENVDFIELDVRLTKDKKLVLCHDSNLQRVAGVNEVIEELNYKQLKDYDIGSSFSDKYSGEHIPTLDNVLKIAKGKVMLNLDIKVENNTVEMCTQLLKLIKKYKMSNNIYISSTSYELLQMIEFYNSNIKTGYISANTNLEGVSIETVDFISVPYEVVSEELVNNVHCLNKEIHVWNVEDCNKMDLLYKLNVDNIITNDVEKIKFAYNVVRNRSLF